MFYSIRNLRVSDVSELPAPWDFDVSGVDFSLSKEDYRNTYQYNAGADHCLVSLVEGVTPAVRVNSKRTETQNAPYRIHGFFADYDGVFDEATMIARLRSDPPGEHAPSWYVVTQSNKLRLVWLFENPINVVDFDHANKLLAEIGHRLRATKWGSDYDKRVSESPSSYFDIGRRWVKFSDNVVKTAVLHLWDYEVFSKIRKGYSSVTTDIPFDVIQQEIRERWPGRFNGIVREGEHCCRFWDKDSDNDRGCIIVKDGVRVFVPHDKPFMSWRDIFGMAFVDKYVSSKVSPIVQQMWFNSSKGQFWKWSEATLSYVPRNETTLKRDLVIEAGLRADKRKGEQFSEVDNALHDITTRREVAWVAPILFHPHGPMHLQNADRTLVLNTSLVRVTPPCQEKWTDDWRWSNPEVAAKFPFIHGLVSTLLEIDPRVAARRVAEGPACKDLLDEEKSIQLRVFLSWLSHFYKTSAALKPSQGQCLVMAGASGIGKTFLMRNVIGPLMGGYKDADKYFIENVKYTGDIISSPVLGIDDKVADLERNERAGFTTRLKSLVATGTMRYEEKFQSAVESVPWLGRVVIVCNMDSRSLSVLPDLEQSNADKITMLRLNSFHYPFHDTREANTAAVARELPFLARFLLHYTPVEAVRDVRMGVKAYQHPEMVQAANDNGYVRVVIEALNSVIDSLADNQAGAGKLKSSTSGEIRGNSRVLYDLIMSVSPSAAREIGGAKHLSQQLEQLVRGGFRVRKERKRSTVEWVIPYDFDDADIRNKEEEAEDYGTISL